MYAHQTHDRTVKGLPTERKPSRLTISACATLRPRALTAIAIFQTRSSSSRSSWLTSRPSPLYVSMYVWMDVWMCSHHRFPCIRLLRCYFTRGISSYYYADIIFAHRAFTYSQEDRFEAFVQPTANPKLTKFCTTLTSITQVCCVVIAIGA